MIILHEENSGKGSFYIEDGEERLAELVYHLDKDRMVIEHTEVNNSLRGKNVGYSLVERSVDYAREQGLKIVPYCTYAKRVLQKTEQFHDVL